jgi:superfamily II DNA or RNA helicase
MATLSRIRRSAGKTRSRKTRGPAREAKLSRLHKPAGMSLEAWQRELRRQFGREQQFNWRNVGADPVFSEFEVTNPESKNTYRIAIRGTEPGDNFCSCPDFGTSTLGTCKHIEFVLGRLAQRRGGKTALNAGFRPPYSEIYVQYGSRREVRFRAGEDCPAELARLTARFFDAEQKLLPDAFGRFETLLSAAANIDHELRCYEDVLSLVAEVRDGERRRAVLDEAFSKGIRSPTFKNLLKVPLYDYQREGALFAARAGRVLIGDEMGLGKTIQALAAAEILARYCGVERVLIVCPTSLKHQWEREIAKFTERIADVIGGSLVRRTEQFATPSFFKITNYDTVHRDLEAIGRWSPDLVILDEAQRIKNWNTRIARSVKRIVSPYAVVLTGTPLENRLEELISIVQFIDRFRLGPTFRLLDEHQDRDEAGRVIGYRGLDRIGQTLKPILIRRRKSEVLDQLPPRLDKNFFVSMTTEQLQHHEENREIVARIVTRWRHHGFLSEADQRRLMIALQNMRMSCDSAYLLDQKTDSGPKADELATLLEELYESPETKVVIFSQWLRMHELLRRRFADRAWDYVLFHGGVPAGQRGALVDRFRQDPACRAFLATDAGGVGLNLQHANVVVNVDLPWNPAVLEQRIGRVHRLGQTQPVSVVNYVAKGTIEEGMLSVLSFKKSLFAGVLDGGESEVFLGGSRLKRFMQTVENVSGHITGPTAAEMEDLRPAGTLAEVATTADRGTNGSAGNGSANGHGRGSATATEPEEPSTVLATLAGIAGQTGSEPLMGLLQGGLNLLQQLAVAAAAPPTARTATRGSANHSAGLFQTARDEATGQSYLQLRLPEPEVLDRALAAFSALLNGLRPR